MVEKRVANWRPMTAVLDFTLQSKVRVTLFMGESSDPIARRGKNVRLIQFMFGGIMDRRVIGTI